MNHIIIAKINKDSAVFLENDEEFDLKKNCDWCLNVYSDNTMMLVTHRPYTQVDYFDNKPAKITYDDELKCVHITRPVTPYTFEFNDTNEYIEFKNLKLEEKYNE